VSRVGHGLRRSRPTATSFTPLSVSGLALWLDASDASTFTYGSGTRVQQWNDKSGNARHFTQLTGANQPNRTGTQNSLAIVAFTAAAAEHMTAGDTLDMLTNNLSVFVAGVHSGGSGETFISKSLTGSGAARWSLMKLAAGTMDPFYTNAALDLRTASAAYSLAWQAWGTVINRSGGSISVRRAGAQQASASFAGETNNLDATNILILGGYGNAAGTAATSGFFLQGAIAEVLVYTQALTGADLTNVESYLRTKWGTP
jgi:hypothetical protein